MGRDTSAGTGLPLNLPQYERLIDDGLASADSQGGAVDHVTARRLAIWLAHQPQESDFTRGLVHFTRTGAISHALKAQLRARARSATYRHQPQASRLMQYCASRGADLGPVGTNFASACDRVDRADLMLTGLRDRVRQGGPPEPAWPDTDGPQVLALAGRDTENSTVSLILDEATANIAMYAINAYAGDREAHVREVEQYGQNLPEGSYGRRNRQAIAARETRVAARLRAIEQAYRTAIDRDAVVVPAPTEPLRPTDPAPDREMEMG
jgi:hypothetical protein